MDDMTARMCAKGEGRISFARVLVEVEAGKDLKKEIEVMYKGNLQHEGFTKKIQVEYTWKPPSCEKCKVFGHDHKNYRPFIVVQNRRVNYEKGKDNRNNNSWNGYNGTYNRQRMILWEIQVENLEKVSNKNNEREASTYNRFTLLNDLVGEDELVPPIEQRKIVDEYMSMENEVSEINSQGWSKEMKK
ncbi:hypothetical protein Tco_1424349 [Tanacetum coccineum]